MTEDQASTHIQFYDFGKPQLTVTINCKLGKLMSKGLMDKIAGLVNLRSYI